MKYDVALRGVEVILGLLQSVEARYSMGHICYDDDDADYRFESGSEFRILMNKKYGKGICNELFEGLGSTLIVHLDDEIVSLLLIGACYGKNTLKDVIRYTYDSRKGGSECAKWSDGIWFAKNFEQPERMFYYMLEECSKRLFVLDIMPNLRLYNKAVRQLDELFRS